MKSSASCGENSELSQKAVVANLMQASAPSTVSSSDGNGNQITAEYDIENSTITVNSTTRYASSAYLGLINSHGKCSTPGHGRGTIDSPDVTVDINPANIERFSNTRKIVVDRTHEYGEYVVILYVNGKPRCHVSLTVPPYGKFGNNFVYDAANLKLTIPFNIKHSSYFNTHIRIKEIKNSDNNIKNPNTSSSTQISASKLEPGKTYTFELYCNDTLLDTKTFTIPVPSGTIQDVVYKPFAPSKYSVTLDYILNDAYNPVVDIYDLSSGNKTLIKGGVAITNSSASKRIVIDNVPIEIGRLYDVVISANGGKWSIHKNLSTNIPVETQTDKIANLRYDRGSNRLMVDFSLARSGVTVGFKLLSTKSGRWYDGGSWYDPQSYGTSNITVPSETGSVLYVVVLTVNGKDVASKQIIISR